MKTSVFISIFALTMGAASVQAAPSVVSAGEHDGYSRLVFQSGGENIAVAQDGRTVRLTNFASGATFDFQNINDRRKAYRVLRAKTVAADSGAAVELKLTCNCTIRTSQLSNGRFVVDVVDASRKTDASQSAASSEPAPEQSPTPASDMISRDDLISVEQAHSQMVELLKQAAREGLITIREEETSEQKTADAAPAAAPQNEPTVLTPPAEAAPEPKAETPQTPAEPTPVVEVTTAAAETSPAACYSDNSFALNIEGFEDEPLVRIAELQAAMAESEEQTDKTAVNALVDGFLAIGFGEEAVALLIDQDEGQSLRADMARVVAERPVAPDGPLMGAKECNGPQALWQAAASESPREAALLYGRSGGVIKTLPTMLKRLMATRLASKMIEASAWEHAEALFAVASEGLERLNPELEYIRARLDKKEGDYESSHDTLLDLASRNTRTGDNALLALADSYAEHDLTPHEGFKEDIGALARLHDSSRATMAEAQSWAGLGNVEAALMLLRNVSEKTPNDRLAAGDMAKTIINKGLLSDDSIVKISSLDGYVAHRGWLGDDAPAQTIRLNAARTAIGFALPNLAYELLDEAPKPVSKDVSLDKAAAALAAGYTDEAITIAAPYAEDDAFAEIIVNANIAQRQPHAALAAASSIADERRKLRLTANAAWLAKSWESAVRAYQTLDPNQLTSKTAINFAVSAYMSGQGGMPPAADAALAEQSDVVAAGLRALFLNSESEATALQRSRREVENTAREIKFFEEVLGDG